MLLYGLTIFLSAFLLFEVQPIMAKIILPWFGGTSAVWSTCLMFFQSVLVLGYGYAHWVNTRFTPKRQAVVHTAIATVSLAALPILPSAAWKSATIANPSLRILELLAATVGLPYFLLSSTSPLLQAWHTRTHRSGMPYRLFALSNAASLLALLSYPFLIEPNLSSPWQARWWSAAYVVFAVLCTGVAWGAARFPLSPGKEANTEVADATPPRLDRLLWIALSASASILLLAVTTHLTQDVAAIPFLWILPLTAYLLTFILCFEAPAIYRRPVFLPPFVLSLAFMAYRLWPSREVTDIAWLHFLTYMSTPAILTCFVVALFVCCMVCHGELVRLKPSPRRLTGFYVLVSIGGAMGGLFVGLIAPNLFRAYYEFPIGLGVCAVTAAVVLGRDVLQRSGPARAQGVAAVAAGLLLYSWGLGIVIHEIGRAHV